MPEHSLTDLRAVRPRGPKIFAALVAMAAVGIAGWFSFLRPAAPRGAPEDPGKILLVSETEELARDLDALGFETERDSLSTLEERARSTLGGLELTGAQAVLELADEEGFGYVVFEHPGAIDFGTLPVSADSADITAEHAFAVFSAGDLAFPHHVTVDAHVSLYPLPAVVRLLRALFAQEKLAATLEEERKRSIESGPLAEEIEDAVVLIGAYNAVDLGAKRTAREQDEALTDPEKADPRPDVLAGPLEQTHAFPSGDGGILLLSRRPTLSSPRHVDVNLDDPGGFETEYLPPGEFNLDARQPCRSLRDGRFFRRANLSASARAQALVFPGGRGEDLEVWIWNGQPGACSYRRAGGFGVPAPARPGPWGALHDDGRVLRAAAHADVLVLEVWTPGASTAHTIELPGCTHIGDPVWVGNEHAVLSCLYEPAILAALVVDETEAPIVLAPSSDDPPAPPPPDESWLYVVRMSDGAIAATPTSWADTAVAYAFIAAPRPPGFALVATALGTGRRRLLTSPRSAADLFVARADDDPATAAQSFDRPHFVPPDSAVALLPAEVLTDANLALDPTATALVVSPDGTRIGFEVDGGPGLPRGDNVAVMELGTSKVRRLGNNPDAAHTAPFFTTDGQSLLFTSQFGPIDEPRVAGRRVPLHPGSHASRPPP